MADLRTDYKDDLLDTSVNTQRKYRMVTNDDGTVSFVDETVYAQNGDTFGAAEVNIINGAVNLVNESLNRYNEETDSLDIYFNGVLVGSLYCGFQTLNALVPTLTSNDSNVIYSSVESDRYAWKVFDNDNSTIWSPGVSGANTSAYVGYKFDNAVCVKRLYAKAFNDNTSYLPPTIKLQYSQDGQSWTTVETITTVAEMTVEIDNNQYAKYWRVYSDTISSSPTQQFILGTLQFYGR